MEKFKEVFERTKSKLERSLRMASWIVVALAALYCGSSAKAQVSTADIVGTVSDNTGAMIGGATVSVTNLATHETKTSTTQSTGDYVFTLLPPSTYSITVTMAGFKTATVSSVTIIAGDRYRSNLVLQIGQAAEQVTVTASDAGLQTDSSVVTQSVTEQAVQDLPLNGRNFINLVQITPGANEGSPASLASGNRPDDRRQSSSVSVNGQSDILNNQMIDGMDNNERIIGTIGVRPSIDAIAEVKVQTSDYTAETGRTAGGVVNIITRSGANSFHGSAYDFLKNDKMDAMPSALGIPSSATGALSKRLHLNQYGGSIGGPIIKNKTFFFGDYEGRQQAYDQNPSLLPVPTLYEEQHPGDFTDAGCSSTEAGAGICGTAITAPLDPAGLDYFKLYPAPTATVGGIPEYIASPAVAQTSNTYDVRVDHQLSTNNLLFARYTYNNVSTNLASLLPVQNVAGLNVAPGGCATCYYGSASNIAHNGQLNYTHTFSANLVLELKAAYTRIGNSSLPLNEGMNVAAAFSMPNINISPLTSGLPLVKINSLNYALGGAGYFDPLTDLDNTFQYMGAVTYVHGQHTIKGGVALVRRQAENLQSSSSLGNYQVTNLDTLLLGTIATVTRNVDLETPNYRTWEPSVYIQDDWHLRTNLTVNLGVRYDIYTPFTESRNHLSNFDPVAALTSASGAIVVAGQNGVSNTAGIRTDYSNFAPRIGFSYSGFAHTVLRGGFGMTYFPTNLTSGANLKNQPMISIFGACSSITCGNGITALSSGLPLPPASPSYFSPSEFVTGSLPVSIPATVDFGYRSAYLNQFDLALERDFSGNIATVSYVGNTGRHLLQQIPDMNAPAPSATALNNANRPYYGTLPKVTTIQRQISEGTSSYNALQAALERRTKKGITLDANYTWAHGLDDSPSYPNVNTEGFGSVPSNLRGRDYGNSSLDIRGRYALTANWALPFGEGLHGVQGVLVRGWQFNVLQVWSTGLPFTVLNSSNTSHTNTSGSTDRPNRSGSAALSSPTTTEFFNTSVFSSPTLACTANPSNPNCGLGNARRNSDYGPHYRHLDLSVFKTISMPKDTSLQLRAEGYNITNTVNWGQPNVTLGGAGFGSITSTSANYMPRTVQVVAKYQF